MNMKRKVSILYAWLVRSITFFLPDIPLCMRFRGFLYGFMLKKVGTNFQVAHSAILNSITMLEVGNNVYIANNTSLLCGGGVSIGHNVIIAPGVVISSDNHTNSASTGFRFSQVEFSPVIIEKNSWVCANVIITAGSVVLEGSLVCPGSAYTKNSHSKSHSIYSGLPAKYIKSMREH